MAVHSASCAGRNVHFEWNYALKLIILGGTPLVRDVEGFGCQRLLFSPFSRTHYRSNLQLFPPLPSAALEYTSKASDRSRVLQLLATLALYAEAHPLSVQRREENSRPQY